MIQAVLFDNTMWTSKEAKKYLREHNIVPIKPVHVTKHLLRYRIIPPENFNSFSSKKLDYGITLVFGYK